MNNFNFKLPEHRIPGSTVVSVVDFESDYRGSSPDLDDRFYSNTTNSNFFNDGLTDNRASFITADHRILLRYH